MLSNKTAELSHDEKRILLLMSQMTGGAQNEPNPLPASRLAFLRGITEYEADEAIKMGTAKMLAAAPANAMATHEALQTLTEEERWALVLVQVSTIPAFANSITQDKEGGFKNFASKALNLSEEEITPLIEALETKGCLEKKR